jgi:hypothetical protein
MAKPSTPNFHYLKGSFREGWGFTSHIYDHIEDSQGQNRLLRSRALEFYIERETSYIRFMWYDNFRCHGSGSQACRWDVRIDGQPCEDPGPIRMD